MKVKTEQGKIDWLITLVPQAFVISLCVLFFFKPEQSKAVLSQIRVFFGVTLGTYYLIIGLGIFILFLNFFNVPNILPFLMLCPYTIT